MTKSDDTDRFPPPWSVEESQACFIVKGSRRPVARVCLFRRGARTPRGGQAAHPGRGPAHCRQHRQASRTAAWAPPIKRGVTSPLKTQVRKYRRNALSDVMGQKQTFFPKALQASCSNFLFVQGARCGPERAEHATITRCGFQPLATALAVVKVLASIRRHMFCRLVSALRAGDC